MARPAAIKEPAPREAKHGGGRASLVPENLYLRTRKPAFRVAVAEDARPAPRDYRRLLSALGRQENRRRAGLGLPAGERRPPPPAEGRRWGARDEAGVPAGKPAACFAVRRRNCAPGAAKRQGECPTSRPVPVLTLAEVSLINSA